MVLTRDVLGFGTRGQRTELDDVIPLREIDSVKDLWHHDTACRAEGGWVLMDSMIGLKTIPGAHNLGRAYCITASFPLDVDGRCSCRPRKIVSPRRLMIALTACLYQFTRETEAPESLVVCSPGSKLTSAAELIECINSLANDAILRTQDNSMYGKFARSRIWAKTVFRSSSFQIAIAILLVTNFCANLIEAQLAGNLTEEDGSPNQEQRMLDFADLTFTCLFTAELALNLYAHWFQECKLRAFSFPALCTIDSPV